VLGRLRDEHLATVTERADARCPVDGHTDVPVAC
jgi:hypothetical protein